tara:strand:+ start:2577 stop:2879 length:303 start_codon:yes stop_codon:yes gene_type:complete
MENTLLFCAPSFSLGEIEDMTIRELEKRILFFNNINKKRKSAELKNNMSLIHLAISAGSNPSAKNNKIFYKQLDKIFSNKQLPDEEESLDDIMNLVNVKK